MTWQDSGVEGWGPSAYHVCLQTPNQQELEGTGAGHLCSFTHSPRYSVPRFRHESVGGLADGMWRQAWAGLWDQQRMVKGLLPRASDGRG